MDSDSTPYRLVRDGSCKFWSIFSQNGDDLFGWTIVHPAPGEQAGPVPGGEMIGTVLFDRRSGDIEARSPDAIDTVPVDDGPQALRLLHLRYHYLGPESRAVPYSGGQAHHQSLG